MFCVNDSVAGEGERDNVCLRCSNNFDIEGMFRANDWAAVEGECDEMNLCCNGADGGGMY